MDEFLNDIKDCLGASGYTLDDLLTDKILKDTDEETYKGRDEELLINFNTFLHSGNIKLLAKYINMHTDCIHTILVANTLIINIYSHNPRNKTPINAKTLMLEDEEVAIVKSVIDEI